VACEGVGEDGGAGDGLDGGGDGGGNGGGGEGGSCVGGGFGALSRAHSGTARGEGEGGGGEERQLDAAAGNPRDVGVDPYFVVAGRAGRPAAMSASSELRRVGGAPSAGLGGAPAAAGGSGPGGHMLTPTGYPPHTHTAAGMAHRAHSTQPALPPHRATPNRAFQPGSDSSGGKGGSPCLYPFP